MPIDFPGEKNGVRLYGCENRDMLSSSIPLYFFFFPEFHSMGFKFSSRAVGLAPLMRYSSRMNPGNYEKKATTIMGEGILIRRWTRFKLEILSG